MHPLPLEYLWSNLAFKRPSLPAHGLWRDKPAHRLPGCCLTVLPGPRQCRQWKFYRSCWPSSVMRAFASPCPYLMGLGSGGTITCQIAISEAHTFRACVCMGSIRLPSLASPHERGDTSFSLWRTKGRRDLPASPSDVLLGKGQSSRASCHRSPYRRLALYCLQGLRTHAVPLGPRPHHPPGGYRQGPGACGVACIC